jgi:hypothetical protein
MNCLESRRLLLQDPYQHNEELLEHEANCSECARFAAEAREQESLLTSVLQAPAPPPELAENVRLAVRLERRVDSGRRIWFAAAASVLLAVSVSMVSLFDKHDTREHMALAQNVIYHIEDEATHLRTPGPAAPQRVHAVLARFGAELTGDIGRINFAAECVMRDRTGVHLVLSGKHGPVTVFLMPGERPKDMMPVDSDRFHGEIMPTQWGSIAVVGEKGEEIGSIANRVAQAVRWPERTNGIAIRELGSRRIAKVVL